MQVYSFKASYLVLLVPPFFDFRALLITDTKIEALVAWKFKKFGDNSAVGRNLPASQEASDKSQHCDKHLKSDFKSKPNNNPDDMTGSNAPSKELPAYPVVGSASAPTPPSQCVNPYQNSPILPDTFVDVNTHEGAQENLDGFSNGNKCKAGEHSGQAASGKSAHGKSGLGTPIVSPTVPWTQLPTSQPLRSNEKPTVYPASNQARPLACAPTGGEVDQEMLPSQPLHMSTPLRKHPI